MTCPTCGSPTLTTDMGRRFCFPCQSFVATASATNAPVTASMREIGAGVTVDARSQYETARTLELPYPLSTNHLFATVDGHRTKSAAARDYVKAASEIARRHFAQPLRGRVAVEIVYRPRRGVGLDVDNCTKCALDSLKGIAWLDDRQIWRLSIERRPCVAGGAFTVRIQETR